MNRGERNKMIAIFDTTLRDGTQAEGVSLLVEDKLRIAQKLDELGVHYIEGGWPGSNPKDVLFFQQIKRVPLKNAKIVTFGSTHNPKNSAENDKNLQALINAETGIATIFGKSWDLHVTDALNIPLERNLEIIAASIKFLKEHVGEVFYDAEHFFEGYKKNAGYALKTIQTAQDAGADCIILCDTNGGMLPFEVPQIIQEVQKIISIPLGIHAHNDSETAVANSLVAIKMGITHVQGTINGIGERCGNANLCSIIPNIKLKLKRDCGISDEQMKKLYSVSRFVDEVANLRSQGNRPYVGDSAFAHKGGIHVNAIRRNPSTYEHIQPGLVGNSQRVLISDQSGKSNLVYKALEFGLDLGKYSHDKVTDLVKELKELESRGFKFEAAEGSFELLVKRVIGKCPIFFTLAGIGYNVFTGSKNGDKNPLSQAVVQLKVNGNLLDPQAGIGDGPVNAIDHAVRKLLIPFYPSIEVMRLDDYKVSILDDKRGTAAKTRVLVISKNSISKWGTVGVSDSLIDASWQALVDSYNFFLLKEWEKNNLQVEKIETFLDSPSCKIQ
ncbi:citramalate synthase [Candidatus Falkowbacteria bacterium RBG_13_39_14]|uniref:Citramalate synthase n=1 Tax=Candidatus Falkowbacteria bacterium RBG_13_39_14 TaxID=1797985 RepID=A0A1F5S869_9BACT|nr:MAG: citramalate synthase [Candidatus Falkowbacteria bacterium RBG_13_39_14]